MSQTRPRLRSRRRRVRAVRRWRGSGAMPSPTENSAIISRRRGVSLAFARRKVVLGAGDLRIALVTFLARAPEPLLPFPFVVRRTGGTVSGAAPQINRGKSGPDRRHLPGRHGMTSAVAVRAALL